MRWMVLAACLLPGGEVAGCRIPVFRYALERWAPDPYVVEVVHPGPLDEAQQALVERLEAAASDPVDPANLTVVVKEGEQQLVPDANGGSKESSAEEAAASTPPQLILHAPPRGLEVWSGTLNGENVERLIDSPARREVVDHLLSGDSAVWILITSGDAAKDRQAEKVLREELERMTQLLELPSREELEAEVEFRDDTPVELRIGFSLIVIKRDDPVEEIFVAQLLASEPDLKDFEEPIATPVFGRGRTYYALVGQGIDRNNIEANCRFVCGDCSCQVKQQNPGVDLLLAADWESNVEGSALPYRELPVLTGIGGLELVEQVANSTKSAEAPPSGAPAADPMVDPGAADATPASSSGVEENAAEGSAPRVLPGDATRSATGNAGASHGSPAVGSVGSSPAQSVAGELEVGDTPLDTALSFEHRLLLWSILVIVFAAVCVAIGSLWLNTH